MRIEGAADVYGVQIDVAFDASQIKVLDEDEDRLGVQILGGDFLTLDGGFEAVNEVDNETGRLIYAYSRLAPAEPASGSGTLFEFEVEALESGTVELLLGPVIVASPEGNELPVHVEDTTGENGVVFVPEFTATAPAQATAVSATNTPVPLTPTADLSQQPTSAAESAPADTATAPGPAAENSVSPTTTQAAAHVATGESPTNAVSEPTVNSEPELVATHAGTAEPIGADPQPAEIAVVPPTPEQDNVVPAAEQVTPALTVIGQNLNLEENQAQPATPAPTSNNEGTIEGIYLAAGLIALSVALIAIWFFRRLRIS